MTDLIWRHRLEVRRASIDATSNEITTTLSETAVAAPVGLTANLTTITTNPTRDSNFATFQYANNSNFDNPTTLFDTELGILHSVDWTQPYGTTYVRARYTYNMEDSGTIGPWSNVITTTRAIPTMTGVAIDDTTISADATTDTFYSTFEVSVNNDFSGESEFYYDVLQDTTHSVRWLQPIGTRYVRGRLSLGERGAAINGPWSDTATVIRVGLDPVTLSAGAPEVSSSKLILNNLHRTELLAGTPSAQITVPKPNRDIDQHTESAGTPSTTIFVGKKELDQYLNAGTPSVTGNISDSQNVYIWEWPIAQNDPQLTNAFIGSLLPGADDDETIPGRFFANGTATELDAFSSSSNYLEIWYSGDQNRFSNRFETRGEIFIQEADGTILASLKNFGSYFGGGIGGYYINSDAPFVIGSRDSLRTALEGLPQGTLLSIFFVDPPNIRLTSDFEAAGTPTIARNNVQSFDGVVRLTTSAGSPDVTMSDVFGSVNTERIRLQAGPVAGIPTPTRLRPRETLQVVTIVERRMLTSVDPTVLIASTDEDDDISLPGEMFVSGNRSEIDYIDARSFSRTRFFFDGQPGRFSPLFEGRGTVEVEHPANENQTLLARFDTDLQHSFSSDTDPQYYDWTILNASFGGPADVRVVLEGLDVGTEVLIRFIYPAISILSDLYPVAGRPAARINVQKQTDLRPAIDAVGPTISRAQARAGAPEINPSAGTPSLAGNVEKQTELRFSRYVTLGIHKPYASMRNLERFTDFRPSLIAGTPAPIAEITKYTDLRQQNNGGIPLLQPNVQKHTDLRLSIKIRGASSFQNAEYIFELRKRNIIGGTPVIENVIERFTALRQDAAAFGPLIDNNVQRVTDLRLTQLSGEPDVIKSRPAATASGIDLLGGIPSVSADLMKHIDIRQEIRALSPASTSKLLGALPSAAFAAGTPSIASALQSPTTLSTTIRAGSPSILTQIQSGSFAVTRSSGAPSQTADIVRSANAKAVVRADFELKNNDPANTWFNIGDSTEGDDISLPGSFFASGTAGEVDYLRVRTTQTRIYLDGSPGRFTSSFESEGEIQILHEGTTLAVLQGYGARWNDANQQYRINNDAAFTTGTRQSFRTALEGLDVGDLITVYFIDYGVTDLAADTTCGRPSFSAAIQRYRDVGLSTSSNAARFRSVLQGIKKLTLSASGGTSTLTATPDSGDLSLEAAAGTPTRTSIVGKHFLLRQSIIAAAPQYSTEIAPTNGSIFASNISAGTPSASIDTRESLRAFVAEVPLVQNGEGAVWSRIGALRDDTDDITLPGRYFLSGDPGEIDTIGVSAGQLRIWFDDSPGRFTAGFETNGEIRIQIDGTVLAAVQNFGSYWGSSNNQYRINDDVAFITGSVSSLRSALETYDVGTIVTVLYILPDTQDLRHEIDSGTPTLASSLVPGTIESSENAGAPSRSTDLLGHSELRHSAQTGTPTVTDGLENQTDLRHPGQSSDAPSFEVTIQYYDLAHAPNAGTPSIGIEIQAHTDIPFSTSSGASLYTAELVNIKTFRHVTTSGTPRYVITPKVSLRNAVSGKMVISKPSAGVVHVGVAADTDNIIIPDETTELDRIIIDPDDDLFIYTDGVGDRFSNSFEVNGEIWIYHDNTILAQIRGISGTWFGDAFDRYALTDDQRFILSSRELLKESLAALAVGTEITLVILPRAPVTIDASQIRTGDRSAAQVNLSAPTLAVSGSAGTPRSVINLESRKDIRHTSSISGSPSWSAQVKRETELRQSELAGTPSIAPDLQKLIKLSLHISLAVAPSFAGNVQYQTDLRQGNTNAGTPVVIRSKPSPTMAGIDLTGGTPAYTAGLERQTDLRQEISGGGSSVSGRIIEPQLSRSAAAGAPTIQPALENKTDLTGAASTGVPSASARHIHGVHGVDLDGGVPSWSADLQNETELRQSIAGGAPSVIRSRPTSTMAGIDLNAGTPSFASNILSHTDLRQVNSSGVPSITGDQLQKHTELRAAAQSGAGSAEIDLDRGGKDIRHKIVGDGPSLTAAELQAPVRTLAASGLAGDASFQRAWLPYSANIVRDTLTFRAFYASISDTNRANSLFNDSSAAGALFTHDSIRLSFYVYDSGAAEHLRNRVNVEVDNRIFPGQASSLDILNFAVQGWFETGNIPDADSTPTNIWWTLNPGDADSFLTAVRATGINELSATTTVSNIRFTTLRCSTSAGTPLAQLVDVKPNRDFTVIRELTSTGAGTTWIDIGARGEGDDILFPDNYFLANANGEIDQIRLRTSQTRLWFDESPGRFVPEFENRGVIQFIQNDVVLAEISNIGSYWNDARQQYRINNDNAFNTGTRTSLRQTLETQPIGTPVSIRFAFTELDIAHSVSADTPTITTAIEKDIDVGHTIVSSTPTFADGLLGFTNLIAQEGDAGTPTILDGLQGYTDLRLSVAVGTPSISRSELFKRFDIAASASGGTPAIAQNIQKHTDLRHNADNTGQPSAEIDLQGYTDLRQSAVARVPTFGATLLFESTLDLTLSVGTPNVFAASLVKFTDLDHDAASGTPSAQGNITGYTDLTLYVLEEVDEGLSHTETFTFAISAPGFHQSNPITLPEEFFDESMSYMADNTTIFSFTSLFQLQTNSADIALKSEVLDELTVTIYDAADTSTPVAVMVDFTEGSTSASHRIYNALSDDNFEVGTRASLEAAFRAGTSFVIELSAGGAEEVQNVTANLQGYTDLRQSASTGTPVVNLSRLVPTMQMIEIDSGTPSFSAALEKQTEIRHSASAVDPELISILQRYDLGQRVVASTPIFEPDITKYTDLRQSANAGMPSAVLELTKPAIQLAQSAGTPTFAGDVQKHTELRFSAGADAADIPRAKLQGIEIEVSVQSGLPSLEESTLQRFTDLRQSSRTGNPSLIARHIHGVHSVDLDVGVPSYSSNVQYYRDLRHSASAGTPHIVSRLISLPLDLSASTDTPTIESRVEKTTDLRVAANAGAPITRFKLVGIDIELAIGTSSPTLISNLQNFTDLEITTDAGIPSASARHIHGVHGVDLDGGVPSHSINVQYHRNLRHSAAAAGTPQLDAALAQLTLAHEGLRAGTPTISINVANQTNLKAVAARTVPPRISAFLERSSIEIDLDAGTPSAEINLDKVTDLRQRIVGVAPQLTNADLDQGTLRSNISSGMPIARFNLESQRDITARVAIAGTPTVTAKPAIGSVVHSANAGSPDFAVNAEDSLRAPIQVAYMRYHVLGFHPQRDNYIGHPNIGEAVDPDNIFFDGSDPDSASLDYIFISDYNVIVAQEPFNRRFDSDFELTGEIWIAQGDHLLAILNNFHERWDPSGGGQGRYDFNNDDYFLFGTRASLNQDLSDLTVGALITLYIIPGAPVALGTNPSAEQPSLSSNVSRFTDIRPVYETEEPTISTALQYEINSAAGSGTPAVSSSDLVKFTNLRQRNLSADPTAYSIGLVFDLAEESYSSSPPAITINVQKHTDLRESEAAGTPMFRVNVESQKDIGARNFAGGTPSASVNITRQTALKLSVDSPEPIITSLKPTIGFIRHSVATHDPSLVTAIEKLVGLTIEISAGTPSAETTPRRSNRVIQIDIPLGTNDDSLNWIDIGMRGEGDDLLLPRDFFLSGMEGEIDYLRSRSTQLRIILDGSPGRFSKRFEDAGEIQIVANKETLVSLSGIGSFWNVNNEQYRINSNDPFTIGSTQALRTNLVTLPISTGTIITVLFIYPDSLVAGSISEASGNPTISSILTAGTLSATESSQIPSLTSDLEPGDINVRVKSGVPSADGNIESQRDIDVRGGAGIPTASGTTFKPTNTRLKIAAGTPSYLATTRIVLTRRVVGGMPSFSGDVTKYTDIRQLVVGAEPTIRDASPTIGNIKHSASTGSPAGSGRIDNFKEIRQSAAAETPQTIIQVQKETEIRTTVASEPPTLETSLRAGRLFSRNNSSGIPSHSGNNVERATRVPTDMVAGGNPVCDVQLGAGLPDLATSSGTPAISDNIFRNRDVTADEFSAGAGSGTASLPSGILRVKGSTGIPVITSRLITPQLEANEAITGLPSLPSEYYGYEIKLFDIVDMLLSASTGTPDVTRKELQKEADLRHTVRTETPTLINEVQKYTDFRITLNTIAPTVTSRIPVTLSASSSSAAPSVMSNVERHTELRQEIAAGTSLLVKAVSREAHFDGTPNLDLDVIDATGENLIKTGNPSVKAAIKEPKREQFDINILPPAEIDAENVISTTVADPVATSVDADPVIIRTDVDTRE